MKTNNIGNVAIKKSGYKKSRFDWTHDVNTTCGWSDIQPLMCRLLPPHTKSSVSVESLLRLAPMVCPTFGRIKLKTWHYFVALSDLSRNFDALMSQTTVSRLGGNTFKPEALMSLPLSWLSALTLIGSHCTIWKSQSGNDVQDGAVYKLLREGHGEGIDSLFERMNQPPRLWFVNEDSRWLDDSWNGFNMDLRAVVPANTLPDNSENMHFVIPLANPSRASFFETLSGSTDFGGMDISPVMLDSADCVVTRSVGNSGENGPHVAFAFRLSAFGKRLRKILLGCGYQIDLSSTEQVSIMPLFAFYKAYYELFGLQLYSNWQTTYASRTLEFADNYLPTNGNMAYYLGNQTNVMSINFKKFILDLGNSFVTDSQDFVSAHSRSVGVSPTISDDFKESFINTDDPSGSTILPLTIPDENTESDTFKNQHSFVNNIFHGQLASELLKRLYKWVNRNSIAGKKIADLLRAQGLGVWVDAQKPRFIGFTEVPVNISDVVSTSDTFKSATSSSSASGAVLGEYGGKGLCYDSSKKFVFENDEFGFWITLSSVVPEAGYCQALDASVSCVDKFKFYNPEFDGLGMEMSPKSRVVGSVDWSCQDTDAAGSSSDEVDALTSSFGVIPRYSALKVANNVLNGDFSLRGTRDGYLPFTIDKYMSLGDRDVTSVDDSSDGEKRQVARIIFKASELPVAGNIWRFVNRFPWLGNPDRIFANVNNDYKKYSAYSRVGDWDIRPFFEVMHNEYDNFILHNIVHYDAWAPMLPISDSFETTDDSNNGGTDAFIGKA